MEKISKIIIATLGGYGISQLVSLAIVAYFPLSAGDKTLFALMLAILIFCTYVIWVFSRVGLKSILFISSFIALVSSLVIWSVA